MPTEPTVEEQWYQMLTEGGAIPRHLNHLLGLLPSSPRCKMCSAPFKGWGGFLMHLMGRFQSTYYRRVYHDCRIIPAT